MTTSGNVRDQLLGGWRVVSAQIRDEDTGEVSDIHGPNPTGSPSSARKDEGRSSLTASERKPPTNDAEAAALHRDMTAYTGRFSLAGDQIITKVDVSWHPAWEGTRQPRFFKLEGESRQRRSRPEAGGRLPGFRRLRFSGDVMDGGFRYADFLGDLSFSFSRCLTRCDGRVALADRRLADCLSPV